MAGDDFSRNNTAKTGRGNPPVEHQFKRGNPGRPKGSRNKLGEAFIADLYAHWQENGVPAAGLPENRRLDPAARPERAGE